MLGSRGVECRAGVYERGRREVGTRRSRGADGHSCSVVLVTRFGVSVWMPQLVLSGRRSILRQAARESPHPAGVRTVTQPLHPSNRLHACGLRRSAQRAREAVHRNHALRRNGDGGRPAQTPRADSARFRPILMKAVARRNSHFDEGDALETEVDDESALSCPDSRRPRCNRRRWFLQHARR